LEKREHDEIPTKIPEGYFIHIQKGYRPVVDFKTAANQPDSPPPFVEKGQYFLGDKRGPSGQGVRNLSGRET